VSESGQRVVILNGPPGASSSPGSPAPSTRDPGTSTVPRSRRTTSGPDTTSWCSSTPSSIHGTSTGSWRPTTRRRRSRSFTLWAPLELVQQRERARDGRRRLADRVEACSRSMEANLARLGRLIENVDDPERIAAAIDELAGRTSPWNGWTWSRCFIR